MREKPEYTDVELLEMLKANSEFAFNALYDRYWELLYINAFQKLRCQMTAEEIVQEIFLTLWKKRQDLELEISQAPGSCCSRQKPSTTNTPRCMRPTQICCVLKMPLPPTL